MAEYCTKNGQVMRSDQESIRDATWEIRADSEACGGGPTTILLNEQDRKSAARNTVRRISGAF
jgi:hypothetical protein